MQDFWKNHKFMAVDARYGAMPVAIAADIMGGKPDRLTIPTRAKA